MSKWNAAKNEDRRRKMRMFTMSEETYAILRELAKNAGKSMSQV